jgi:flagellar protein FlaG
MQSLTIGNTPAPARWSSDKVVTGTSSGAAPTAASTSAQASAAAQLETTNAVEKSAKPAAAGDVKQAIEDINKTMGTLAANLEFSYDSDADQVVVKVVNETTSEIIRQMPTEEALEIAKALDKVQGLLIRQTA